MFTSYQGFTMFPPFVLSVVSALHYCRHFIGSTCGLSCALMQWCGNNNDLMLQLLFLSIVCIYIYLIT